MGEEVKEKSQEIQKSQSGDPFYILVSEREWLQILKSYRKMAEDLGNTDMVEYFDAMYKTYEELKKRDYVLEFYYSPSDGAIKLFARPKEEYEIYKKKLFELYGIM